MKSLLRNFLAITIAVLCGQPILAANDCSRVTALNRVNGVTIDSARWVAGNNLVLTDSSTGAKLPNEYPFCRIHGAIAYAGNNSLRFELWLPENKSYNGRYMATGNGGLAGTIDTSSMMQSLNRGYAVAAGDSGHNEASNGNGTTQPEQYIPFLHSKPQTKAWIHDSIANLTPPTRNLTMRYYGSAPRFSYFSGCSTGGAQGFALAQFHPELFDGIYAGSPGNWYSHLILAFLWNARHSRDAAFLDRATLNFTTNAILSHCDGLDGVVDGLIENPLKCSFNITSLACHDSSQSSRKSGKCLTKPQIAAINAIYQGPRDSRTGQSIYPGYTLGSEKQWLLQETSLYLNYSTPILQNLVFRNLSLDTDKFDFGADVDAVDTRASPLIDAITTDLSAFRRRGGKMVVTQGWTDPYNGALWCIRHLEQLQKTEANGRVSDFLSLYMIPGGGHCGPASFFPSAPSTYHVDSALRAWVENDTFPEHIITSRPLDGSRRTRKLCPWPQSARFKGHGADSDDAASFVCA